MQRPRHLLFQAARPPIPELHEIQVAVEHAGGIDDPLGAADTERTRQTIRPALFEAVTGNAGNAAILG